VPFRLPGKCPPITLYGNPVLRTAAEPVTTFGPAVAALVDDLFETMYAIETGVGLAANQIGRLERVFVFDCGEDEQGYVVNPVVEVLGEDEQVGAEGCLSVPGISVPTARGARARVRGQDVHGDPISYEGEGLVARCFQHELDHLDGVLYVDRHAPGLRAEADEHLQAQSWFGTAAIDPRSKAYREAQAGDVVLDPIATDET
jgi:peptide deformylase